MKTNSAEEARKRAEQSFSSGLFCAESVVLAIAESQGVDSELLPRVASAFCGGMSRTGGTCGALTGAVMGVSMSLGRTSADEPVQPTYTATQRLVEEFEREFGSRDCPTLLSGCDLNTTAGQEQFRERNLAQRCLRYSGKAAEIAVRVIADSKDSSSPREEGDEAPSSGCVCC